MCLMRLKNKNILIILSLGIVLIVSMFFAFNNKKEYKELPKVKLKEPLQNKQFALMLEQEDGNYLESEGELPTDGYHFNKEKSGCVDINGKIINDALDYDYYNHVVLLDTSKTSYCYLYYDIETITDYLRSKDIGNYLSSNLVGGIYRYQGLGTDPINNYICLGDNCCNTTECSADTNDDMYRIICVTENDELKVIKKTGLDSSYQWHTDNTTDTKWPDSDLFHQLNDYNEGSTYKDTSFYSQLTENLKSYIISDYNWLYGDAVERGDFNGDTIYKIESGNGEATRYVNQNGKSVTEKYTWSDKIAAPIGIQYLHDYYYAYPGGNPTTADNAKTAWIHLSNNEFKHPASSHSIGAEWTMTRYSGTGVSNAYVHDIYLNGTVGDPPPNYDFEIRPVFYLSNEIELSGKGALSDPFTIF